jgi:hypothetical protein
MKCRNHIKRGKYAHTPTRKRNHCEMLKEPSACLLVLGVAENSENSSKQKHPHNGCLTAAEALPFL